MLGEAPSRRCSTRSGSSLGLAHYFVGCEAKGKARDSQGGSKAPCVIDLGPPHGEERLLTLWTRKAAIGPDGGAGIFLSFFLSILARSLS